MKFSKSLLNTLPLAIIFLGLLGYSYMNAAWVKPIAGTVAPDNNSDAPINTSSKSQGKIGGLSASALVADTVVAVNMMKSPKYCDQNGENCLGEDSPSIFNSEVQYFESYVTNGGSSQTTSLGNWTFCGLGRQTTTADDNDMQDSCFVSETKPGYWQLVLNKHSDDTLKCGAQCLYLGQNRDVTPAVTNYTYRWVTGARGACRVDCGGSCGQFETSGTADRSVNCMRSDGLRASDSFCTGVKPDIKVACTK